MTETAENPLGNILREKIAATGGIPFVEFMEQCLYHPEHGYYMAPRQRIGKGGDFFTSSSVHALFGRLIARQLIQMAELLDDEEFRIVEQGAGEGHLALDILDAISEEAPELYARTIDLDPDHVEAGEPLSEIYLREERFEEVEPVLDMLVRKADRRDNKRVQDLQFTLGQTAAALEAAEAADRYVTRLGESNVRITAARLALQLGDLESASQRLDAIEAAGGSQAVRAELEEARGDLWLQLGSPRRAVACP